MQRFDNSLDRNIVPRLENKASELSAAFATKEAELVCFEILIFEAKWRSSSFLGLQIPRRNESALCPKQLPQKASAHFHSLR